MTIAIGMHANDGVVLAADSQETVTGYIKGEVGKIRTTIFADRTVLAIVGAGSSDYIETAKDKAVDGVASLKTFPEIQNRLEENLLGFFDKHLARFNESERPSVELLIGLSLGSGPFALFHYSGTAFRHVSQKAIGSGILLADGLLSDLAAWNVTTMEHAASIALYIVSKVKTRVDGCGGFSDVIALRNNGDFAFTDMKKIKKLEERFGDIERAIFKSLKKRICSREVPLSWQSAYQKEKGS